MLPASTPAAAHLLGAATEDLLQAEREFILQFIQKTHGMRTRSQRGCQQCSCCGLERRSRRPDAGMACWRQQQPLRRHGGCRPLPAAANGATRLLRLHQARIATTSLARGMHPVTHHVRLSRLQLLRGCDGLELLRQSCKPGMVAGRAGKPRVGCEEVSARAAMFQPSHPPTAGAQLLRRGILLRRGRRSAAEDGSPAAEDGRLAAQVVAGAGGAAHPAWPRMGWLCQRSVKTLLGCPRLSQSGRRESLQVVARTNPPHHPSHLCDAGQRVGEQEAGRGDSTRSPGGGCTQAWLPC